MVKTNGTTVILHLPKKVTWKTFSITIIWESLNFESMKEHRQQYRQMLKPVEGVKELIV